MRPNAYRMKSAAVRIGRTAVLQRDVSEKL